jgi:hypothetical protein
VSGKALAAGEIGLRLPAQNPRLAPCGSPITRPKPPELPVDSAWPRMDGLSGEWLDMNNR